MTNPIPQDEFPEEPDSDDDLLRRLDQTVIAGTGWGMPRIDGISLDVVAGRAAARIRALEKRIDFHKSVLNVQTGFFNAAMDRAERVEAEVARLTKERAARNAIDPVTRLHNLCDHLAEHRAESPYNAEALELADADVRRYQAENAKLRAVVDAAKAYVVGRSNLEWRTLVAAIDALEKP